MGTSYSAIKIPVPGNLIDTPGALPWSLLHFQDGVYTNFIPLIIDLRPDSGAGNLTFNVSVATGDDSYSALTETGMYLYQHSDNDMRLSINNQTAQVNSTLHVEGNARITEGLKLGPDGDEMKFSEDGYTHPTDADKHKFMSYNTSGAVLLETLQESTSKSYDDYLSFSNNQLVLDLKKAKGDGIIIEVGSSTYKNTISADVDWLSDPDNGVHTGGTGILIDGDGKFSVDPTQLNNDGEFFTGGDGISPIVNGVISADVFWLRDPNNGVHSGIAGVDVNEDGVISADVDWLSDPDNGVHTGGTGILIDGDGKFSVDPSQLNSDGEFFTGGNGISPIVNGVISADVDWLSDPNNGVHTGSDSINISSGGVISADMSYLSDYLSDPEDGLFDPGQGITIFDIGTRSTLEIDHVYCGTNAVGVDENNGLFVVTGGINLNLSELRGHFSADVFWLRDPNNGVHTAGTGILISTTGKFSVDPSQLNDDGGFFTGGNGISPIVDGVIKIDTNWTQTAGNLFSLGTGIGMTAGTLEVDFKTPGSGVAISESDGTVDSLWTKLAYAVTGNETDGETPETINVRAAKFAATGTAHDGVDFVYIVGSSRVNYLGDVENESFWNKSHSSKSFSAIFKPLDKDVDGHGGSYWLANDGGGIKIQTTDNNNDEFAILCESITDATMTIPPATGGWDEQSGHPQAVDLEDREMFVTGASGGDGGYPTFYVKASSGMMYNSSNYYTEGRICIGATKYLESGKLHRAEYMRKGMGPLPNPPAHVNIISTTPSIMMHQVLNPSSGLDNTASTIIMSSNNNNNKHAWGCISGSDVAATIISNRDSSIFNIETTTKHMPYSIIDVDQDGLSEPTNNGISVAENRFRLGNSNYGRVPVWSLEYYPLESSSYITGPDAVDEVTDDTQFDPTYYYMKMGCEDDSSMQAGTFYLPIGEATTGASTGPTRIAIGAQPPEGMKDGGFWIDDSEYRFNVADGDGIMVLVRANNLVRCKLGNEASVPT